MPNVSSDAVAALSGPSSGICDPYGLTYGAAENAAANGVKFMFDARVVGISREDGVFSVEIQSGCSFSARSIVNCAGIHSDEINNLVSGRKLEIMPIKGEYLLYHNALAGTFRRTMFQTPAASGKGVLVAPVAFGNIFIGPNAVQADGKDDLATTEEGQRKVLERARRTWPEAPKGAPALVDELAIRGIPVQCNTRVARVSGADRLESVTIAQGDARETLECDLLIVSPCVVSE